MHEPSLDPSLFDELLGWAGASIAAVGSLIAKVTLDKAVAVATQIDKHEQRLVEIEANYVSRGDVENILTDLQRDLQAGFTRAHERIDQLYNQRDMH